MMEFEFDLDYKSRMSQHCRCRNVQRVIAVTALLAWSSISTGSCSGSCQAFAISRNYGSRRAWVRVRSLSSSEGDPFQHSTSSNMLSLTVQEDQVQLSNGISMQVLSCLPQQPPPRNNDKVACVTTDPTTILVFLHGSFHGAWCWAEHWLPYFAQQRGYICVAPSWRGTGGTPVRSGAKKTKIDQHVDDIRSLLELLPVFVTRKLAESSTFHSETNATLEGGTAVPLPVVLISHSFGGLVVMKYLERYHASVGTSLPTRPPGCSVGGIVSMCSVPPSGNGRMTRRYLQKSLRNSWKITRGLALKHCCTDVALCRELFFQSSNDTDQDQLSDAEIERYQGYFARDSVATIDLMDLARKLPSAQTKPDTGQALFLVAEDRATKQLPCLVLGARHDFIVDRQGLEETSRYYFGTTLHDDALVVVDSPHDVMLGPKWKNAAHALDDWLQHTIPTIHENYKARRSSIMR
jgi:pimeloyl-ACP methyl ester carboxylesterase